MTPNRKNSISRFSNRVADYVKFRPNYPNALMEFIIRELKLTDSEIVADLGSGTGISSRLFLENKNRVYAIEPNLQMRNAGKEYNSGYPHLISLNGTAENTGLNQNSVDIIIAGQAFHWFNIEKTREEAKRILNYKRIECKLPSILLFWNSRSTKYDKFHVKLEEFLFNNFQEYRDINHVFDNTERTDKFFDNYKIQTFLNPIKYNWKSFFGRISSSSYTPSRTDKRFPEYKRLLHSIFKNHQINGEVKIHYITELYYGNV